MIFWPTVILCLLAAFIFSGIEAGLMSVNRVRLRHRVKQRDRAALRLNRLLADPERLLVTVLVVTNLMTITAIVLTTQELVRRLGWPGYGVALAVWLPIYLFGLELLPKSLFRRFPYRALAALTWPLRIADAVLSPMHFVGWRVTRLLFGKRPPEQQKLFAAREDFKYLTIESERLGTLSRDERAMIHNVVDFRGVAARDVMVPMERVQAIQGSASVPELLERSRATNLERWPVLTARGEISGLVDVLDIALDCSRRGAVELYQRRIVRVRDNEPAYSVLRKLRAARLTLAVVTDGGAKALGIVSVEDLVRRLVSSA